jgi:PST family polysaccharide transporter
MTEPITSDNDAVLWSKFAHSVRSNALGEVASQAVRVGGFVALARMLEPSDIGLLRILLVVSLLAGLVCEGGIPDALVQRADLQPQHEATSWWLNAIISVLMVIGLYVGAPTIEQWMNMPRLAVGIQIICPAIVLEGLAWTANARLRRRLEFGPLAASEVAAEIAFVATALTVLLVFKRPRLSLSIGLAARLGIHALWICGSERYLPRQLPSIKAASEIGRFAVSVAASNALQTLSSNVDYILVGRFLGSAQLGFYSMAWDLLRFITNRLSKVAGRVTLPAFCQLQNSNEKLAQAYQIFVGYMGRIVLPAMACIAVAAPEILTGIYGAQWLPAAWPLRFLAPGLAIVGLTIGMGSVFFAKDRPSLDVYLHGVRLILIVVTVLVAVRISGILGVALGMSIAEGLPSIGGQWMVGRLIDLKASRLLRAILPGLGAAVSCAIVTALGKYLAYLLGLKGAIALPLIALPPAAVFLWLEAGTLRNLLGFGSAEIAIAGAAP